jgi:hypothetical protein
LGYTAVCRGFPFAISPHSLPFRSTSGESEYLACAAATAPGNVTRRNVAGSAAALA